MVVPGLKPEIFDALVAAKTPWECPWLTILKYASATAEHLSGALPSCPVPLPAQRSAARVAREVVVDRGWLSGCVAVSGRNVDCQRRGGLLYLRICADQLDAETETPLSENAW